MAIFFDSFAKAADYFGGVISPQRLGQLADAQQLRTQEVASGHGGPPRRRMFHEDIAVHLERGDKLDAHDCPCWRVAYAQALDNDVLPASDVPERVQELLDLERAEWAKEREYLYAARRLVQSDVEMLQQTIAQLQEKAAEADSELVARDEQLHHLEELHAEDAVQLESDQLRLADLRRRVELLDLQHAEERRVLHHQLEVKDRQRTQLRNLKDDAVSKRTEAQTYLWDLDRKVRRQALAVLIGGPILLLAAGAAGWALERFVLG